MNNSYVEILKNEFTARNRRNPAYSLRAFAQVLGMKAPHLSDVFKEKKGLSLSMAHQISDRLNFDNDERLNFCDLVLSKHARKPSERIAALARLQTQKSLNSFHTLEIEQFKLISEWQHFAILHLFELHDFKSNKTWIAKRLGLAATDVETALERLEKLKLINREVIPWRLQNKFTTVRDVPSTVKKQYQHGLLRKAQESLDTQKSEERDYSSVVLAMNKAQLPEARTWIQNFRRKFCADLDANETKDSIYCLSVQFFKLSQGD